MEFCLAKAKLFIETEKQAESVLGSIYRKNGNGRDSLLIATHKSDGNETKQKR